MNPRITALFARTPGQRNRRLVGIIAAVIVVPLAVAGFFAGALASSGDRLESVPALVVNNDEMVTMTLDDGTEQPILAGRQLVTELTGGDGAGFDWTVSNSEDAAAALAAGQAYAVLTIPSDFSASINSISGSDPSQAKLDLRTDDAHAYIAGSAAQAVGEAMSSSFGREITKQYLTALYDGLSGMGGSLSEAADGAGQLSTGAGSLATGLDGLATGAVGAADGAVSIANGTSEFADGVGEYTAGVDSLASGLGDLSTGAAGLTGVSDGVSQYVAQLKGLQGKLSEISTLLPDSPENADFAEALAGFQSGFGQAVAGGDVLSAQTSGAVTGIQGGIQQSANGAAQIAAGSGALRDGAYGLSSGASELSTGLGQLASGASSSATGAHTLATGVGTLASGLATGAQEADRIGDTDPATAAGVVSQPVTISTARDNPIDSIGPVIGMIFVPVGLWIGAIAIFLLLRPAPARALASTAPSGRILWRGLAGAGAIAVAQAIVVVALLHTALGVTWAQLPQTLAFAVLLALVFTAVHHFLVTAFGRLGIVVSIVLLALQLTSAGGLYPIEILAAPFQALSPLLPLSYAVQGMQAIVAGVGGGAVAGPAVALLMFGGASVIGSLLLLRRKRGASSYSFALARA